MENKNRPIGIFDSGLGGISVLNECKKALPYEHYIYYGDSKHAPYGIKSKEEILERCIKICNFLIKQDVKAIIIACNTATSVAVETLRKMYSIPIIGMEPALKPATMHTKKQTIIVMATQLTLNEKKFDKLVQVYGRQHTIIKMPCPDFVKIVEHGEKDKQKLVFQQIDKYKDTFNLKRVDYIVLGCTHFVFLREYIQMYFPKETTLIDGNHGTVNHLSETLEELDLLALNNASCEIYNSSDDPKFLHMSQLLLTSTY